MPAALGARLAESEEWVAHFRRAGLHPRDLRDHASLAAVPTLEKADLRQRYPYPFLTVALGEVISLAAGNFNGDAVDDLVIGFRSSSSMSSACVLVNTAGLDFNSLFGGSIMPVDLQAYVAVDLVPVTPVRRGRLDLRAVARRGVLSSKENGCSAQKRIWR